MKKQNLFLTIALTFALILSSAVLADADNVIKLRINGEDVMCDVAPEIVNDRTMVPIRAVAETLDYDVKWADDTKTVTLTKDSGAVVLVIGNAKATVVSRQENDSLETAKIDIITLDTAPYIKDSRTFVPLRFIAESFGETVNWNQVSQIVTISDLSNTAHIDIINKLVETYDQTKILATNPINNIKMDGNKCSYNVTNYKDGNLILNAEFSFVGDELTRYRYKSYDDAQFTERQMPLTREAGAVMAKKFAKDYFNIDSAFDYRYDIIPSLVDEDNINGFVSEDGKTVVVIDRNFAVIVLAEKTVE